MKELVILCLMFSVLACGTQKENDNQTEEVVEILKDDHHSASITKVFDAHGGFANWAALKQLSYDNNGSHTLVELQNRYTRIDSEERTIGFDGKQVWVLPETEDAERYKMRYNLMFYFYAFPFVIGDPGVSYEDLEPIELKGKTYNAVKISYADGVGDSPKDNYIVCSDPETNQMEWLLYTATFGGDTESDRYGLIKYDGWVEKEGVFLPSSLQWHTYKDGAAGEPRGNANVFENIQVSTSYPDMKSFEKPVAEEGK